MEKYNIKNLFDPNGSIEVTTDGGVVIFITLDLLRKLIPPAFFDKEKKNPVRAPNNAELAIFASAIIEDKLSPYKKECWCYWLKGEYTTVVSAFSRMRKVHCQKDYRGWTWGWIGTDGSRYKQGDKVPNKTIPIISKWDKPDTPKKTETIPDVIGAWGRVMREGREPWYHEIFLADCPSTGQWNQRKFTMFSKTLRDQAHKFAYSDIMGNLSTENETPFHMDADTTPDEPAPEMGSEVIDIPDPTTEDQSVSTPAPPVVETVIQPDSVPDVKSGQSEQDPKGGCPF